MGIKNLNKFLLDKCSSSIYEINLKELKWKTIAIDTSIYLYKFLSSKLYKFNKKEISYFDEDITDENILKLIKSMNYFIDILKKNNITPIFIFDGKPPEEKKDLLKHRKKNKKNAENKLIELKKEYELVTQTPAIIENSQDLKILEKKMEILEKKSLKITEKYISVVKKLFDIEKITYFTATGEADELCCQFVLNGKCWACMSDDMDLFVHGCPRVIRNFNFINCDCMLYILSSILRNLSMPMTDFREIMVLSGTDYNFNERNRLYDILKLYEKYKIENSNVSFYEWLNEKTKFIKNYEKLKKVYNMFIPKLL